MRRSGAHRLPVLLLVLLVAGVAMQSASAEKLSSTLSAHEVRITSSFEGETLTLFGAVEPEADGPGRWVEGPFDVVITIAGPASDLVARRKTNQFGFWINTGQVTFDDMPSYYRVLASGPLADIADPALLAENILPGLLDGQNPDPQAVGTFAGELVRLMQEKGLYGVETDGVRFLSDTAYRAQVALPSDVPLGSYTVRTLVLRDGAIVATSTERFTLRKTGFEGFLGAFAVQHAFPYALACVLIAIMTGWLGGIIFKR